MRAWWMGLWVAACGSAPTECPPAPECTSTEAATATADAGGAETLDAFEAAALGELLADLRAGPRPFEDAAWGVCTGSTRCDQPLGPEPGELPPGDHVVAARLAVPQLGGPWTVRFDQRCVTSNHADQTQTQDHSRTYTVGVRPNGGYRLDPLFRIQSPHPTGARTCQISLTPIRSDGVELPSMVGKYATPLDG